MPSPAKRVKLLSDSSSSEDESDSGVKLPNGDSQTFKINKEFARRFEHNKKREEQHRLEEQFKQKRKRSVDGSGAEDDSDESTDESEDDDAELATKALDNEIFATLAAIKNKDPKVYDKNVKFYKDWENEMPNSDNTKQKKEKPMYLQDYHRQQLMAGLTGEEDEEQEAPPMTHEQEQAALREQMVGEMHGAQNDHEEEDSSDDEMFQVKSRPKHDHLPETKSKLNPARARQITDQDILNADKDPETYLSNFMVSRAWLPSEDWRFEGQEFNSDDSDDEQRAEIFEDAYNMRFEDPATANEKLKTFSRDAAAKSSVRRENKSGRKKAREQEQESKAAEKEERRRERERLKKLKMDDMEEKVHRIKEAAGLGKDEELDLDAWRNLLEGDFTDKDWDAAMQKQFNEQYYAEKDNDLELDGDKGTGNSEKKSKPKKPKFNDDIDIKDIVPDFKDDHSDKPGFTLSSDDEGQDSDAEAMDIDGADNSKKQKSYKKRKQETIDAKRAARKERAKIESIVDSSLPLAHPHLATSSKKAPVAGFRYRETSPTSFGLTARDILFASDADLNSYAGLKKMTAFRDEEKKQKDRKKFSKKARLRQWRKETFGKPDEPQGGFEHLLNGAGEVANERKDTEANGKRKRKRSSKKAKTTAA